jgi:hypothetical protein
MVLITVVVCSSDRQQMSLCPSLLQTTGAIDVFYLSLLCYHCSDAILATGQLPVATVAYGPLL